MNKITQSINKSQEEFEKKFPINQVEDVDYLDDVSAYQVKEFLRQSNTDLLGALLEEIEKLKRWRLGEHQLYTTEKGEYVELSEIKQIIQEAVKNNNMSENT